MRHPSWRSGRVARRTRACCVFKNCLLPVAVLAPAMGDFNLGQCMLPGRMQGAHVLQRNWRPLRPKHALDNQKFLICQEQCNRNSIGIAAALA